MMKKLSQLALLAMTSALVSLTTTAALAKLPAPSDEAKAKAAETAAKTAWSGKVDGFLLCKSQDKTAAYYYKTATSTKPAAAMPPCADPGLFVYPLPLPVATAPAAGATPAVVAPASPVAAAVAPAKKP